MQYINTQTAEYPVTLAQIRAEHPLTMFPEPFEDAFGPYAPVADAAPPEHNPATHKALELVPVQHGGQWRQAWQVVALTQEEMDEARRARVPQRVSRRQARKALVMAALFDFVQPAIDSIADPIERQLAQIDWDDSQEFARDWPLLLSIGQSLGLDAEDMDQLFIEAASH